MDAQKHPRSYGREELETTHNRHLYLMPDEIIYLFEDCFTDRFALSLPRGLERLAALSDGSCNWILRGACRPEDLGRDYPEARRLVSRQGYCVCRISHDCDGRLIESKTS